VSTTPQAQLNQALGLLSQVSTLLQEMLPTPGPQTQTGTVLSIKGQDTPFGEVGPFTTIFQNTDGSFTTLYTMFKPAVVVGTKYVYTYTIAEPVDTLNSFTAVS